MIKRTAKHVNNLGDRANCIKMSSTLTSSVTVSFWPAWSVGSELTISATTADGSLTSSFGSADGRSGRAVVVPFSCSESCPADWPIFFSETGFSTTKRRQVMSNTVNNIMKIKGARYPQRSYSAPPTGGATSALRNASQLRSDRRSSGLFTQQMRRS